MFEQKCLIENRKEYFLINGRYMIYKKGLDIFDRLKYSYDIPQYIFEIQHKLLNDNKINL